MPRIARRISTQGGRFFEVATRGVEQRLLFLDDEDRRAFLDLLADVVARHGWRLHAYCLLATEVHLVVETTPSELSRGMHRLLFRYAQRFNARHDRTGHLFAGRFGARVVRGLRALAGACVAVVWNPVRLGLCAAPRGWPWSGGMILGRGVGVVGGQARPPPQPRARSRTGLIERRAPLHWRAVPRNRTARQAVLGVSVRRPAAGQLPSRSTTALRRRLVVGVLVLLALTLITVSYRQDGTGRLGAAENAAAAALRPFQVAAERVAQPFRDAAGWVDSLLDARSDAKRLRAENERLRQQAIQNQFAAQENATLRALLDYRDGSSFPRDFDGLAAAVISQPAGAFAQAIVVAVGSKDGVEANAPVVTADGLIGLVERVGTRTARVTLLTDERSAVSARDVETGASGIVRHGRGSRSTLVLHLVPKEERVRVGDTVVTSGWRSNRFSSLYPRGIPIGTVTSVGDTDTDLYKQVQVTPFADFTSIDAVLVLVPKEGEPAP